MRTLPIGPLDGTPPSEGASVIFDGKVVPARPIVVVRDGVKALDYLLGRRGDGGQEPNGTPVLIVLDLCKQIHRQTNRCRPICSCRAAIGPPRAGRSGRRYLIA
jgi:hypothetical protein